MTTPNLESAQLAAESGNYDALNRIATECAGRFQKSTTGFEQWTPDDGRTWPGIPNFCTSLDATKLHLEQKLVETGWLVSIDQLVDGWWVTWFSTEDPMEALPGTQAEVCSLKSTTEQIARVVAAVKAHWAMKDKA